MTEKTYIERETALAIIDNYAKTVTEEGQVVVAAIRDIISTICPSADVQPIRYGQWKYLPSTATLNGAWECSACKQVFWQQTFGKVNFCSHCGAKIDWQQTESATRALISTYGVTGRYITKLCETVTNIEKLSGYSLEDILKRFAAGFTLQAPCYDKSSLTELANLSTDNDNTNNMGAFKRNVLELSKAAGITMEKIMKAEEADET